ncbi:MAG: gliding motility-associated C-terminal domain-containing protein [Bacteroidetes bacterium]|nr:gliding motility-associated C-terminal domain-containing protein [Bacteroidota bacterium]
MKFAKTVIWCWGLLCCQWLPLAAQVDTEFWFAAPDVSPHNQRFNEPIVLVITTLDQAGTVTVQQPANAAFSPVVRSMSANAVEQIDLSAWLADIQNAPANTLLNKGLYITSTAPITAYYEVRSSYCNCNPELFSLKGRNALGTEFYTPFQNWLNNSGSYNPTPYSAFDIVATEDNTTLTITPTQALVGRAANTPFNITLNRGQTYSGRAAGQGAAAHPTGTHIVADKPVAVTMKDDLLALGGCADLLGDQILPIDRVGSEYIVIKHELTSGGGERVFILATQPGTALEINGAQVATLQAGEQYQHVMGAAMVAHIRCSAPVYVLHVSGLGCEVGAALLPPIVCTGSSQVGIARSGNSTYRLSVLVPAGGEHDFTVNGNPGILTAAAFADVPGTGGAWKYLSTAFNTTQFPIGAHLVANNSQSFHLSMVEGANGGGAGYGYFSSVSKLEPELDEEVSICPGDSALLDPGEFSLYLWETGETSRTLWARQPGWYKVQVRAGNCFALDSIEVLQYAPPTVSLSTDTVHFCSGATPQLTAPAEYDTYTWFWIDAIGQRHQVSAQQTFAPTPSLTGRYILEVTQGNPCPVTDSLWLEAHPIPVPNAVISPTACLGNEGAIHLDVQGGSPPYTFLWADGPATPDRNDLVDGDYQVTITDARGCGLSRTYTVPNGIPDPLQIHLNGITAGAVLIGEPQAITLQAHTNRTAAIRWRSSAGEHTTGESFSSSYKAGDYCIWAEAEDADGCTASDSVCFSVIPRTQLIIPNAFSPNQDGINDVWQPSAVTGIAHYEATVYTRWGTRVWSTADITEGWDGTLNGQAVPEGVYLYRVWLQNLAGEELTRSGSVTLLR